LSLVNFAVFSAYSKVIETAIHKLMKILFLTSFLTLAAFGQQLADKQPVGKNLWRASMVTLAATNALDIQSSWGKREMNGTLAGSTGRFDGRSALLKLGVVGGVWTLEYLVLRRQPALYRKLAFVNFGDSSVTGALAIRNYGVPLH
jgi:hypothetical protein